MIELLQRGRGTLGPYRLPQAWLDEQEKHYWVQRERNHRGSNAFVAKPMHSPRKISREKAMVRERAIIGTIDSGEEPGVHRVS